MLYLRQVDVVVNVGSSGDAISPSNASGKGAEGLPIAVLLALVVQQLPVEGVLVNGQVPSHVGKDTIQRFVLYSICAQVVSLHNIVKVRHSCMRVLQLLVM